MSMMMSTLDAPRRHSTPMEPGSATTISGQSSGQLEPVCTKRPIRYRTLGFPALRTESRRVTFTQPLAARCVALDETWSTDCQVLSVWTNGARLLAGNPKDLARFLLFFASGPMPVFRRCKRVWVRGNELEVSYERRQPSFAPERDPLHEAPSQLFDR